MTVPLPSTESHRWQPEIQLWCAHEQWLFSAELRSCCTSGSVCWIFSASIRLVPYITKRRYVFSLNELPSALLQHWSDLHKPLSVAKAEDARHQQRWKCFSCFLWLSKHKGSAPWLPWRDLLFPTFFVMASLFRHQLLCGKWEVMLNWGKKWSLQRCRMWACKSHALYKITPQVSWEESKGGRLAEAGEVRVMSWEVKRRLGGWWHLWWSNWRDERTK